MIKSNVVSDKTTSVKKGFIYERDTVDPSTLKPNPIFSAFYTRNPLTRDVIGIKESWFYQSEAMHFNYYGVPVITNDGIVLNDWRKIEPALQNNVKELVVDRITNLEKSEIIRFINFEMFYKKLHPVNVWVLLKCLFEYIRTDKGKEWVGDKINVNQTLANITGYSLASVKLYLQIGRRNPDLFFKENTSLREMAAESSLSDFSLDIKGKAVTMTLDSEPVEYKVKSTQIQNGKRILNLTPKDENEKGKVTIIFEEQEG